MSDRTGVPDRPEHDDVHTLVGAYALDALDDVERASVERHLEQCAECRDELRGFTETAARLGSAARIEPPHALRDRVLDEISRTRQLPPLVERPKAGTPLAQEVVPDQQPAAHRVSRRLAGATGWLAAAASVLLIASVGLGALALSWRQEALQARAIATEMQEVVGEADVFMEADFTTAGHGAMLVADDRFMLVGSGLPDLPKGQVYKLWFIDDQGPRPSVPLSPTGDGRYVAEAQGFRPGDVVAITIESDPDTDVPRGQVVMEASA